MTKIAIDLLPLEFKSEEIKRAKFVKVQFLSVAIILLMIFLASLTVALSILQSRNLSEVQSNLVRAQQRISGAKDTQASLLLLKDRLTVIKEYLGVPSAQAQMYSLLQNLMPASITVNSISIDKGGEILILAIAPDGNSIDQLLTNLTLKDKNEDKVSKVSVESLSRGRDGIYRISFKIKPKT